jgi:hypothetical protein
MASLKYLQRCPHALHALHAGVLPGHPASRGCIRLTNGFANRLWHLTKRGTRVIIAHDDVQPVEIANPRLFKPKAASGTPESRAATVAGNSTNAAVTHGRMTELEEAQLTEGQGRALSAHRTKESYAGYAKRTEHRMLSATRKRHAHWLANQTATPVQNETGDSIQNGKSKNERSA